VKAVDIEFPVFAAEKMYAFAMEKFNIAFIVFLADSGAFFQFVKPG